MKFRMCFLLLCCNIDGHGCRFIWLALSKHRELHLSLVVLIVLDAALRVAGSGTIVPLPMFLHLLGSWFWINNSLGGFGLLDGLLKRQWWFM